MSACCSAKRRRKQARMIDGRKVAKFDQKRYAMAKNKHKE
jgi:hypothetical protein